jgi:ligand-binding SRPBCC domain-containing protein
MPTVRAASHLDASVDAVWRHVTTPEGVNDELRPWMRMTVPAGWTGTGIDQVAPGTFLGRSWILLFGFVPFDFDDLTVAEVGPGHFLERSRTLSARVWEHERTVTAADPGCEIRDRITFDSRFGPLAPAHAAVVRALFARRHARLRRRFGDRAAPPPAR